MTRELLVKLRQEEKRACEKRWEFYFEGINASGNPHQEVNSVIILHAVQQTEIRQNFPLLSADTT